MNEEIEKLFEKYEKIPSEKKWFADYLLEIFERELDRLIETSEEKE